MFSLAVVGLLALSVAATASAASTPYAQWRSAGDFVPYGKVVNTSASSNAGLNFQGTTSGAPVWITCSTLQMTGSIENPRRESSGVLFPAGGSIPKGSWQNCQVVEYGNHRTSENTQCQIENELPVEFVPRELQVVNGVPTLPLEARVAFNVECPGLGRIPWKLGISGTATELWEGQGQYYFPASSSKVVSLNGVGLSPESTASWGIGLANSAGPISLGIYSAPEPTPGYHWFLGGAKRSSKEGPARLIKEGSPQTLTGSTGNFILESVQSGVSVRMTCANSVQGTVENPTGGGPGVANATLTLSSCQFGILKQGVFETRNCAVQGGGLITKSLVGTVVNPGVSYPTFTLAPPSGTTIGEFTVAGCTISSLNHTYTITGKLNVKAQMSGGESPGQWQLPEALNGKSTGSLFLFGQVATAKGAMTAEVGGEVVTMG